MFMCDRVMLDNVRLLRVVAGFTSWRDASAQRAVSRTWQVALDGARLADGPALAAGLQPFARQCAAVSGFLRWCRQSHDARTVPLALPADTVDVLGLHLDEQRAVVCVHRSSRGPTRRLSLLHPLSACISASTSGRAPDPAADSPTGSVVVGKGLTVAVPGCGTARDGTPAGEGHEEDKGEDSGEEERDPVPWLLLFDTDGRLLRQRSLGDDWQYGPVRGGLQVLWPYALVADWVSCATEVRVYDLRQLLLLPTAAGAAAEWRPLFQTNINWCTAHDPRLLRLHDRCALFSREGGVWDVEEGQRIGDIHKSPCIRLRGAAAVPPLVLHEAGQPAPQTPMGVDAAVLRGELLEAHRADWVKIRADRLFGCTARCGTGTGDLVTLQCSGVARWRLDSGARLWHTALDWACGTLACTIVAPHLVLATNERRLVVLSLDTGRVLLDAEHAAADTGCCVVLPSHVLVYSRPSRYGFTGDSLPPDSRPPRSVLLSQRGPTLEVLPPLPDFFALASNGCLLQAAQRPSDGLWTLSLVKGD